VVEQLAGVTGETLTVAELRARVHTARRRPEEAAKVLRAFLDRKGPESSPLVAATLDHIGLGGEGEEVMRAFAAAKGPPASLQLAQFLARRGKVPEALDLCEKAKGVCHPDAVACAAVVVVRAGKGTDEQAKRVEAWLDAAAEKDPRSVALMLFRADLMQYRRRFDNAAGLYREVLAREPRNVIALNNLGLLLAHAGRAEEGLGAINAAIAASGPDPSLLDTRAIIQLRSGRPDRAVEDLKDAIAQYSSVDKQFHLALALFSAGDREGARAALRAVLAGGLNPADIHPLERPDWDALTKEVAH
jgi:tetratricopeptide (TPR) repeat protein